MSEAELLNDKGISEQDDIAENLLFPQVVVENSASCLVHHVQIISSVPTFGISTRRFAKRE